MNNQTIIVRNNLKLIWDKFEKEIKPEQFDYSLFVSEFDYENNCGTVCCIAGWFPKLFPYAGLKWDDGNLEIEGKDANYFSKSNEIVSHLATLIECEEKIIEYLFMGVYDLMVNKYKEAPEINTSSNYEEVKQAWKFMIENYEHKEKRKSKFSLT